MSSLQVRRVGDTLPKDFHHLLDASLAEGVANMALLAERWIDGSEPFDGPGEALFAAFEGDALLGVGGVSVETRLTEPAMRMRRFYVLPAARGRGVGRALAERCIQTGLTSTPLLTCNARASAAAGPFWERFGFEPVEKPEITHMRDNSGTTL